MNDEAEMARRFFGYGRWDAPYWFIGPEQGKGPEEAAENTSRVNAWVMLQKQELCDCIVFHDQIGEKHWHRALPDKPRLQRTWRPLILLLKTFLNEPGSRDDLRSYQRDTWGCQQGGETCVIELSGLAAKTLHSPINRKQFRNERVGLIREKIQEHKPRLVVMYGKSEKQYWHTIASAELELDRPHVAGPTVLVMTTHPNTRGRKDADWMDLGERLREAEALGGRSQVTEQCHPISIR